MIEELGKNFYADELLRFDFSQIHGEAKRQEEIHPSNKGELAIAKGVYIFFNNQVIPSIISEDWIFQAALTFVEEYIQTYFNIIRLSGDQTYKWQQNLLRTNNEVIELLARMSLAGKVQQIGDLKLPKASDFRKLILHEKLTYSERLAVDDLHQRTLDHEDMQLTLTLKNIGEMYEVGLPRIMFVVRRVIKHINGEKPAKSDNKLLQPSDYLDWYAQNCDSTHHLYPIIGDKEMQAFLKLSRNVSSHHIGLQWNRNKNTVTLADRRETLEIPIHLFQQRHRYLVYLIDYGARAILAGFCKAEHGEKSNKIFAQYEKVFPSDFPSRKVRGVKLYPE